MRRAAISVVVVSWNTRDLLRRCLSSVAQHLASRDHEVLVVDNASTDGSPEMVAAEFPHVRLLRNRQNEGFGRANNQAMCLATGDLFLLLNSDAHLVDGSIAWLAGELDVRPDVGVFGPRLVRPDGSLQPSAYRFGRLSLIALEELGLYKMLSPDKRANLLLGGYWDHSSEREADWLVGACLLVKREVFERTRGFDPTIFLYGEDEEWCERIRSGGWRVVFQPSARVVHVGHASAHRSIGEAARVQRCLEASDSLVRRREGRTAAFLAGAVRVAGALLKAPHLGLRRLAHPRDEAAQVAFWTTGLVLRWYLFSQWSKS